MPHSPSRRRTVVSRRIALLGGLAALSGWVSSALAQSPATAPATSLPAAWKVTSTTLYTVPPNVRVVDSQCGTDNETFGLILQAEATRKFRVVVNGVSSPDHDWVAGRSLSISPEGGRFAYQVQHDDLSFNVIGRAGKEWNAKEEAGYYLVGHVLFAADGSRYAYVVQKDRQAKRMAVVVDGREWPEQDQVFAADMVFSPGSGKRFGVRAKAGDKQMFLIDGVAGPAYDSVAGLVFSADGSRYAYAARVGKQWFYVIDGKETARYALAAGITFSNDGKRYAFVIEPAGADGQPGGKQQLVYNDGAGEKAFQPVDGIGTVAFSPPDGRRIAMSMQLPDKKWTLVVDGKTSPAYDGTGALYFSPDGKRLAAVVGSLEGVAGAGRAAQQFLLVDGKPLPTCDVIASPTWSPDGSRLAWISMSRSERSLMLDDRRIGPGSFYTFSPDSRHIAHAIPLDSAAGSRPRLQMAIDGVAVPGAEAETLLLGSRFLWESPTSARILIGQGTEVRLLRITP
jgi:hypothetical protein